MFHYTMAWITIFLASYSKFFTTLFHNFSWFFQHFRQFPQYFIASCFSLASVTKYHRLGALLTTENFHSSWSSRSIFGFWWGLAPFFIDDHLLYVSSYVGRSERTLWVFFYKVANSFCEGSTLMISLLQNPQLLIPLLEG